MLLSLTVPGESGAGPGNLEATEPRLKIPFLLLTVMSLIFLCLSTQGPVSQEYVVLGLVARSKGEVLLVLNGPDMEVAVSAASLAS